MAAAWDAFISYARAASQPTAVALQHGLERFARPWHQRRAVRIFRDDSALSTNPALWSAIEEGLTAARHLVVLLSPAARDSAYVNREVAWWLEHKGAGSVLLVLDSGELAWDEAAGGFTADSPVPPAMRDAFGEEPRWLDLRWLRDSPSAAADSRFAAALADLSAPLRGVPRDELVGEDLTQHRRVRRLARSAVALLVLLLAASIVSAVLAVRQRDDVLRQAVTLRSRELAAASSGLLDSDLRLAQQLAVQGYRTEASAATREALLQATFASPLVDGFVSFGAEITALATSPDGRTVAVGLAGGEVYTLPADRSAAPVLRTTAPGRVTALRTSADGRVVLIAAGDAVSVWDGAALRDLPGSGWMPPEALALSPSGARAVVARGDETTELVAYDTATGQEVVSHPDPLAPGPDEPVPYPQYTETLAFTDEDTLRLVGNDARWLRLDLGSGRVGDEGGTDWVPSFTLFVASERADYLLTAPLSLGDAVRVHGLDAGGGPSLTAAVQLSDPLDLAISPDGSLVLVNDSASGLSVAPVRRDDAPPVVPTTRITGLGAVSGMAFLTPTRAVAASRNDLAFLSFGGHGRGTRGGALAPRLLGSVFGYAVDWRNSGLAVSPDGSRLAVLELTSAQLEIAPLPGHRGGALPATPVGGVDDDALVGPVWLDDSTVLVLAVPVPDAEPPPLPPGVLRWDVALSGSDGDVEGPIAAAAAAGTVLVAGSAGTVQTLAAPSGDLLRSVRAGAPGVLYDLAAFSADLHHVALVSTGELLEQPAALRVVEVATGGVIHEQDWPTGTGIAGVEFAGSTVLVSRLDGSVEVLPDLGRGPAGRLTTSGVRTSTGSVQRYPPVVGADGLVGVPTRSGLQLYDLAGLRTAGFLPVPPGFGAVPRSYAFAPDGRTLVTGYFGEAPGTAGFSVRDLTAEAAVAQACGSAGGALSEAQWSRVIGDALPEQLACR